MGLEDLAMFRAIQGSTVFYPSDGVSCERAVELAANTEGICFIRTGRPAVPVIYDANEEFAIGKAKVGFTLFSTHLSLPKLFCNLSVASSRLESLHVLQPGNYCSLSFRFVTWMDVK